MSDEDDDRIARALEAACGRRDAGELDAVFAVIGDGGWSASWAPVLARLLGERWHHRHEELADALQDLRDPVTVDALYAIAAAPAPYNTVDDGRALARKCVWALHDIGTPTAVDKLRLLAACADDETRAHASKRLAALAAGRADAPPAPYRVARERNIRPPSRKS